MPPTTTNPLTHRHKFPTGARPAPRHKLLAVHPHHVKTAPPPQCAWIPAKLDMWGNDQYGDCVTAEEAFAKATYSPEIFIDSATVIAWAQSNGFLDGADLPSVMDAMAKSGFQAGTQVYDDGPYTGVDYSNETVLQSALSQGPVKIGIMSSALPQGAGNQQGWYAVGAGPQGSQDHCVALCGYGPAGWLFQQLNVPLPSSLQASQAGYLLFTWSTIGFVDFAWITGACGEAWLRNPTTVGVPPLPGPTPPAPPMPPTPTPPISGSLLTLTSDVTAGTYPLPGVGTLVLANLLTAGQYNVAFSPVTPAPPVPPAPPTPPVPSPDPQVQADLTNAAAAIQDALTRLSRPGH